MLTAAVNLWLLPATLFFDVFSPPPKPAIAEIIPFARAAQRIRRKRKVVRSKREIEAPMYGRQGFPFCPRGPDKGWHRTFDDAIPLPGGRVLKTLGEAGHHINQLSKTMQQRPEWQLAAEMLLNGAASSCWPRSRCAAR